MIRKIAKDGTIVVRDHESIKLNNKEDYTEIAIEKSRQPYMCKIEKNTSKLEIFV